MVKGILDVRIGDALVLKKPHPCGSNRWHVVRLGADIGVRCEGCRRRLLMPRPELARRVKSIERGDAESRDDRPAQQGKFVDTRSEGGVE